MHTRPPFRHSCRKKQHIITSSSQNFFFKRTNTQGKPTAGILKSLYLRENFHPKGSSSWAWGFLVIIWHINHSWHSGQLGKSITNLIQVNFVWAVTKLLDFITSSALFERLGRSCRATTLWLLCIGVPWTQKPTRGMVIKTKNKNLALCLSTWCVETVMLQQCTIHTNSSV